MNEQKKNFQDVKEKWEMNIEEIEEVGKFFESNNDYINMMKVTKKYKELTSKYQFNPIDDCDLFPNITTQHFYTRELAVNKKSGMKRYVYWYKDGHEPEENEIIKDVVYNRYIRMNIRTFKTWSGLDDYSVLYDSDVNGYENDLFKEKILNHENLFFIIVDP